MSFGPPSIEERVQAAQRFIAAGQLDAGETVLRDVLEKVPDHADALCALGAAALAARHADRAFDILGHAASAYPEHHGLLVNLGLAHQMAGRLDEALLCLERAVALEAGRMETRLSLAQILFARGDLDRARHHAEAILARAPEDAAAHALLGAIAMGTGESELAERALRRALELEPADADSLQRLSVFCIGRGRFDEALALAERARLAAPLDLGKSLHHAYALASAGRFAEAQAASRRLLAVAPAHHGPREILARALIATGDVDAGIFELSKAVKANPKDQTALLSLVGALHFAGRFEQALPFLEHAARLAPEDELVLDRIVTTRLGLGRFPPAPADAPRLPTRIAVPPALPASDLIVLARLLARCAAGDEPPTVYCTDAARNVVRCLTTPLALAPIEAMDAVQGATRLPALLTLLGLDRTQLAIDVPYLAPEPSRKAKWLAALSEYERPAVGVVWERTPLGPTMSDLKSALPEGVTAVSLTFDDARHDLKSWPEAIDAGVHLTEPAELIAAISCLDAVIGPDHPVLHLAGALGRPGVVLVPPGYPWYWCAEDGRSLWYPELRVVRQARYGAWQHAVAETRAALAGVLTPASADGPGLHGGAPDGRL